MGDEFKSFLAHRFEFEFVGDLNGQCEDSAFGTGLSAMHSSAPPDGLPCDHRLPLRLVKHLGPHHRRECVGLEGFGGVEAVPNPPLLHLGVCTSSQDTGRVVELSEAYLSRKALGDHPGNLMARGTSLQAMGWGPHRPLLPGRLRSSCRAAPCATSRL